MKVAIITPYYKEPAEEIIRCMKSVQDQTHKDYEHFVVSDGFPQDFIDSWPVRHIRLGKGHGDFGDTPRGVAGLLATAEGFDAVMYLDADNYIEPSHIQSFVEAYKTDPKDVLVCKRYHIRPDGSRMPEMPASHSDDDHVDTGCFFVTRNAFDALTVWATKPKPLSILDDRVFFRSLQRYSIGYLQHQTVAYKNTWQSYFRAIGEEPPACCKPDPDLKPIVQWWESLSTDEQNRIKSNLGFAVEDLVYMRFE